MLSSSLCKATDSGVSTDTGSTASDGERVTEIVDIALDLELSSDSDDAGEPVTPAPRLKFNRERPTPQARVVPLVRLPLSPVRDVVLPSRQTSLSSDAGKIVSSDTSPQSVVTPTPTPEGSPTCKRCAGEHFGKHTAGCPDRGRFKSYATCTRCQCISTTKKQWRFHIAKCQSSRLKDTPAPQHSWDDHVTHVTTAIVQLV